MIANARSRTSGSKRPVSNCAAASAIQKRFSVAALWTFVLAIDFVISFSYTLSPRKAHP